MKESHHERIIFFQKKRKTKSREKQGLQKPQIA